MPKISVIVPVYKVEKYLARCVDSILAQTFKDYELILVDDGSPDNCPKICDEYAAKYDFIHVIHKENGGLSDARNFGIEYALTTDSEWITFIDSDDWVHPQYLEILYNTCIENKADVSCCQFEITKELNKIADFIKVNNDNILKGKAEFLFLRGMNTYSAWGRLYYKKFFNDLRFPVGKLFEDTRTTYKILYICKRIVYIKHKLYYYFHNDNGIMLSKLSLDKSIDEIMAHEEHLMFLYSNKYYLAAVSMYGGYHRLVEKLAKTYSGETVDRVYNHFCEIKNELYNNKKYIQSINKYKKISRINNLKNDFKTVKREKNIFYAFLFYFKNLLKIYRDKQ